MHELFDEGRALGLDRRDPLRGLRDEFLLPASPADPGVTAAYFTGNSLGCQPRQTRDMVLGELDDWARLGVDGHLSARRAWLPYHEFFRESMARVVGGLPHEVVVMNSLTVNLHLMMVSFYRPTRERFRIVIEDDAFPSDSYAVASQARFHGFDPDEAVVRLGPRRGERCLRTDDVVSLLREDGGTVALVALSGVNYLTGQWFDMPAITEASRRAGAVVGWDLAHAAGNVRLLLHDWGVDYACWCTYKYLNAGPGAVGGCFVHERHAKRGDLPRFAGWWGNDPATRFEMRPEFVPRDGADGWQLSNPPVLSLTPLRASLDLFDRATMPALRAKSEALTGYLESLIGAACDEADRAGGSRRTVEIVTPRDSASGPFGGRGCQLSLRVRPDARALQQDLHARGIVADFREPDVVRIAPVPLYNSFHDCWKLGCALRDYLRERDSAGGS